MFCLNHASLSYRAFNSLEKTKCDSVSGCEVKIGQRETSVNTIYLFFFKKTSVTQSIWQSFALHGMSF